MVAFRGCGHYGRRGLLYIVDRTKDMIIRGGLNVYPREVEEVIIQNEDFSLEAFIGTPHERFGEEIAAYVVLKETGSISESDLMHWVKDRVAVYKYPGLSSLSEPC